MKTPRYPVAATTEAHENTGSARKHPGTHTCMPTVRMCAAAQARGAGPAGADAVRSPPLSTRCSRRLYTRCDLKFLTNSTRY